MEQYLPIILNFCTNKMLWCFKIGGKKCSTDLTRLLGYLVLFHKHFGEHFFRDINTTPQTYSSYWKEFYACFFFGLLVNQNLFQRIHMRHFLLSALRATFAHPFWFYKKTVTNASKQWNLEKNREKFAKNSLHLS